MVLGTDKDVEPYGKESHTNHDIESDLTQLNYDLHNDGHIDYLKTVKDKIEQNVETNRAIRKDAVVMCELGEFHSKYFPKEFDRFEQILLVLQAKSQ